MHLHGSSSFSSSILPCLPWGEYLPVCNFIGILLCWNIGCYVFWYLSMCTQNFNEWCVSHSTAWFWANQRRTWSKELASTGILSSHVPSTLSLDCWVLPTWALLVSEQSPTLQLWLSWAPHMLLESLPKLLELKVKFYYHLSILKAVSQTSQNGLTMAVILSSFHIHHSWTFQLFSLTLLPKILKTDAVLPSYSSFSKYLKIIFLFRELSFHTHYIQLIRTYTNLYNHWNSLKQNSAWAIFISVSFSDN